MLLSEIVEKRSVVHLRKTKLKTRQKFVFIIIETTDFLSLYILKRDIQNPFIYIYNNSGTHRCYFRKLNQHVQLSRGNVRGCKFPCLFRSILSSRLNTHRHTDTHTHTYIYIALRDLCLKHDLKL